MKKSNNIYVAKLGKTVGLKGFLRLFYETDFPEQFNKGSKFTTNKNLTLTVKEFNKKSNQIQFEEFLDVEKAKILTNQHLYTTIEETRKNCQLKENEFFWFDLVDCEIVEENETLGVVTELHRLPASDYLEVKTNSKLVNDGYAKTFLLPHLFDIYITNVDIDSKKIFTQGAKDILESS